MKNYRVLFLFSGLLLLSLLSFSQEQKIPINEPDYNKPKLFAGLPDRIALSTDQINDIVTSPLGRSASFRMTADNSLLFDGEVVSTASKFNNSLQSIVIRSSNFAGARLTLTKITNSDGSIRYTGRIISFKHGDLYEVETENGQPVLVKKNYYELVNE